MKKFLLDLLICPACLPEEFPLEIFDAETDEDDIICGYLHCAICNMKYPIQDGIAIMLPHNVQRSLSSATKYETDALVSSYLWNHYAELFNDPEADSAYSKWASLVSKRKGMAIDTGCAVGRFTFEMCAKADAVIGIDISYPFIRLARQLFKNRTLEFSLIIEGDLTEQRTITIPDCRSNTCMEFIVGDVLSLPFFSGAFSLLTSLNLLDKVPEPVGHLKEINRVAQKSGAEFLFSDPFSWSVKAADKKEWLGGKGTGRFSGRGAENVKQILAGEGGILEPSWNIKKEGSVTWKVRNHANHYELIRSQFIVSER